MSLAFISQASQFNLCDRGEHCKYLSKGRSIGGETHVMLESVGGSTAVTGSLNNWVRFYFNACLAFPTLRVKERRLSPFSSVLDPDCDFLSHRIFQI